MRTGDIYTDTKADYLAGRIHSIVAISRLATDRDFLAEAELDFRFETVADAACQVVLEVWRPLLIAKHGGRMPSPFRKERVTS